MLCKLIGTQNVDTECVFCRDINILWKICCSSQEKKIVTQDRNEKSAALAIWINQQTLPKGVAAAKK